MIVNRKENLRLNYIGADDETGGSAKARSKQKFHSSEGKHNAVDLDKTLSLHQDG